MNSPNPIQSHYYSHLTNLELIQLVQSTQSLYNLTKEELISLIQELNERLSQFS